MRARNRRGIGARAARSGSSPGFTLVELLVVISIIGMLAALLLPAINSARESGRQSVCTNNMRNVAIALTKYEQRNGSFPGYLNVQAKVSHTDSNGDGLLDTAPGSGSQPTIAACSWVFPLLPDLERNDLYEAYGPKAADDATNTSRRGQRPNAALALFRCPSDPRVAPPGSIDQPTSYVVNCGMRDKTRNEGSDNAPESMSAADAIANGVFFNHYPDWSDGKNILTADIPIVNMSASYISAGDGTSTTLMISENADAGFWNVAPTFGVANKAQRNLAEQQLGFIWWPQATNSNANAADGQPLQPDRNGALGSGVVKRIVGLNDSVGQGSLVADTISSTEVNLEKMMYARPAAYHPGVVLAGFCDTRVTKLSDQMDYLVYCLLMTPKGRDATVMVDPDDGTPIPPAQAPGCFRLTPLDENAIGATN